jgi:ABC-2 type transport system permease protein
MKLKKYFKFWLLMSKNSFLSGFHSKIAFSIFLFGKIIRFGFFLAFLIFLIKGTGNVAGFNTHQATFFFLSFNLIDVISQFMFREVYRFRPMIVNGDFDLVLSKPINSLFRSLLGGADIIDFVTIPPLLILSAYFATLVLISPMSVIVYVLLMINGLVIATSFHIMVLCFAILTLEADHVVWIYRDLTSLGRFPVDIYRQPLKGVITYLIPIGIMFTFPAKALMGLLNWQTILMAFVVGFVTLVLSLKFWNLALKSYTSASS